MHRSLRGSLGAFVVVALAACGGEDRGRPSAEPPKPPDDVDPCTTVDGYEFQTIVDFDYKVPPTLPNPDVAQCDAAVWVPPMTQEPSCMFLNLDTARSWGGTDCKQAIGPQTYPEIQPLTGRRVVGEPIGDGRCGSQESALHFIGQNVATCIGSNGRLGWGGSIEVLLSTSEALGANEGAGGAGGAPGAGGAGSDSPPGQSGFDARDWDGISFWIRRGGPGHGAFIITVADPATNGAPYCSTAETAPDVDKCDAFGVSVTLTDEWTFVAAPFSALRQKGFGVPSPFGDIDRGNITRLNILASAGNWDFWLDDVSFYRKPQ